MCHQNLSSERLEWNVCPKHREPRTQDSSGSAQDTNLIRSFSRIRLRKFLTIALGCGR